MCAAITLPVSANTHIHTHAHTKPVREDALSQWCYMERPVMASIRHKCCSLKLSDTYISVTAAQTVQLQDSVTFASFICLSQKLVKQHGV